MMGGMDFDTAVLVFGIFGLVLCHLARGIAGWPRRLCVAILCATMADTVAGMIVRAASQYQVCIPMYRALLVVQNLTAPIPTLLMFAYMLHCCGEDYRRNTLLRVLCVLSGITALGASVMEIVGEIGPAPDYELRMGLWLVLFFVLSVALSVVTLIALFCRWKKLTNTRRVMFLLSFFTSRSAAIIFVEFLLAYDLIRRYLAQQEESRQQRTRLAVAQMRPHFIYNTLMSLYYLCVKDPEKTQRVIRDFTRYLQNNFTAIAEEEAIPFTKELEHTKAYLAVEQGVQRGAIIRGVRHAGHVLPHPCPDASAHRGKRCQIRTGSRPSPAVCLRYLGGHRTGCSDHRGGHRPRLSAVGG